MQNDDTKSTDWQIKHAAECLRAGKLVSFPTETVYGLGADATNEVAVQRVFAAKCRPPGHPCIVHIAQPEQIKDWAQKIPEPVWKLARYCWPGPLTVILPKQNHVSNLFTGEQNTIGLRIPRHPMTLAMLREFGGGIIGPSANRYGHISPTSPEHVSAELGDAVEYILPGGNCGIGIESTVISFIGDKPEILRQGAYSAVELSEILGQKVEYQPHSQQKSPGTHRSHYAPRKPLYLVDEDALAEVTQSLLQQNKKLAVVSFNAEPQSLENLFWRQAPDRPQPYAQALYATIRDLDKDKFDMILIAKPPLGAGWAAVNDRLTRASKGHIDQTGQIKEN